MNENLSKTAHNFIRMDLRGLPPLPYVFRKLLKIQVLPRFELGSQDSES